MEESRMKKTVHINVPNQPGISGSFPWVPGLVPTDGTIYTIDKNTFPMKSVSMVIAVTGPENHETLSGNFQISGVDDYGDVSFNGNFVFKAGKGDGAVTWKSSGDTNGSDTWTSDTTTPIPYSHVAKAKSQTP